MKKVSIIIPIYKVEAYIHQCIDSVIMQSYNNLEIILIDDGSPDSCPPICDEYAKRDSRIVVIHQTNGGVSKARNKGIAVSSGDYIFFLDGDDYLNIDCITNLVKEHIKGISPIVGYKLDFSETGTQNIEQSYGLYNNLADYLRDFHKYFATKFSFVWGKLFDAAIIRNYNIRFPEDIMLGEDMLFNLSYYNYFEGKIAAINYDGYFYRQSGVNSLSKKFDPRMFDWNERAYNELKAYLLQHKALDNRNYTHLMNNIVGNYLYSFHLIALNEHLDMRAKICLISKFKKTPIFLEATKVCTKLRLDAKIFLWLIKSGHILLYIKLEKLKFDIKK